MTHIYLCEYGNELPCKLINVDNGTAKIIIDDEVGYCDAHLVVTEDYEDID